MKILYLMHVDWNWIKQRPHFIAEYLQKRGVDITVCYRKTSLKENAVHNDRSIVSVNEIYQLRGNRFSFIKKLNAALYRAHIKNMLKKYNYDYVYITHPDMYFSSIKNNIIYDCMDDNAAFFMSASEKNKLLAKEKKLIEKSALVLFSSQYLAETVIARVGFTPKKYKIINNAINLPSQGAQQETGIKHNDNTLVLTYVGTISDWFDVELLKKVQSAYTSKKIIYNLYGPVDTKKDLSGCTVLGPINHDEIFTVMAAADVLIMPFVLTDLIRSVNPVKLYEYIYSGKPVISLEYGETQKFKKQVYLYKPGDADSFITCLDEIVAHDCRGKLSIEDAYAFVKRNTWENRVGELIALL